MNFVKSARLQTGPLAQAGVVALWGASSQIRSVQRGTIALGGATSATATVTAVDTANAVLRYTGIITNFSGSGGAQYQQVRVALTNATTITATRFATGGLTASVGWELIEYQPGVIRSIQRGTIAVISATSATATITRVDPNKAQVDWLGQSTDSTTDDNAYAILALTDGVTVTATRGAAGAVTDTVSYQVVEWF